MLKIVISGNYYKDNAWFSSWNARQKKNCVYFYDYDKYTGFVIQNMEYSEIQRFRLHLYQKFQKKIKFTKFIESDTKGDKFEGYKLLSPIIDLSSSEFAELLDVKTRKKYFDYDDIKERYYYKGDFINYVNCNVI